MIDTSVLIAGLVEDHEHHAIARSALLDATRLPAITLAETFAQLRRTFAQPASAAVALLKPWSTERRILPTAARSVAAVLAKAEELNLGGNIHDALVAQTCLDHKLGLSTLDQRQHAVALALGVKSLYLLA